MKKSTYKNCTAGHFYPANLDKCPFCKAVGGEQNTINVNNPNLDDKTQVMGGDNKDQERTVLSGGNNNSNDDKTVVSGKPIETPIEDRTMVYSPPKVDGEKVEVKSAARKLVGWLVSYTINPLGVDFRLYEGQNTLGRDAKCDIRIIEDNSLSSKHAIILYRNGSMYFRDEMSTNPSFVDGEEVLPGNTVKLTDGSTIQVGNTIFMIRFSIQ